MSQIIVYRCNEGVLLATDSRAVAFQPDAEKPRREMEIQKVFPLTPESVIVTAGAGYGILLCRNFQAHVRRKGLYDFEDISRNGAELLPAWMAEYRRNNRHLPESTELDRLYILIAGHDPENREDRFPVLFLVSEHGADPLHAAPMPPVFTIPRQVTFEYRLTQLLGAGEGLSTAESLFESFLSRLADADEDVGPPFYFVRIDSDGARIRAVKGNGAPSKTA